MRDRQHDRIARIREEIHQAFQAEIAQVGDADAVIVAEELAQIAQASDLDEGTTDRHALLDTLVALMHEPKQGPVVLAGPAGAGKSTAAATLAEHAKKELGHQLLWISAIDPVTLSQGLMTVARRLGGVARDVEAIAQGASDAADRFWRLLDEAESRWLLVFDEADDPKVLAPAGDALAGVGNLTGWVRSSARGLVLVTSRETDQRVWGEIQLLPVDALEESEAVQMLRRLAPAAGDKVLPRRGGDLRVEGAAYLLASPNQQRHGDPPQTGDRELDHAPADTALAADSVVPRRAEASLAQSRDIGRAAHNAVDASELLAVPGRDLRILSHSDREETQARVTRWRELLSAYPPGSFGAQGSAMVLDAVAIVSEALIADRDERTALRLMRAASAHLKVLGRHDRGGFRVRRAWAEAWSELGHYWRAERLLRRLSGDEQRVKGFSDPRTAMLLLWALIGRDQLQQAAEGFQALTSLAQSQDIDLSMLGHFECRKNWTLGQLGLVEESAKGYGGVIEGRSTVLGPDDPETLDARHSLAKMLVLNGQGVQAIPLLESLVEDRAHVLGERHPDTLETWKYLHLARMQAEPRNGRALARAIKKLEHILRTQDESHGPGHPMTRDTAAWLPKLHRLKGQLRFPDEPPDLALRHRKEIPDDLRPALLVTGQSQPPSRPSRRRRASGRPTRTRKAVR